MEVIAENKTIITKGMLSEFTQKTFYTFNKKYRAFFMVLFIISLLALAVFFIIYGLSWWLLFFIFYAIFSLFMFFKAYVIKAKENYKNLKGLHGELPEFITKFYEDGFETITKHSNFKIQYNKITRILETENLYILMVEKQGIMLLKTGFTNGSFVEFKSFIEKKCKIS